MDSSYLWLIPAFPLLGAIINGILALSTSDSEHGPSHGMSSFIAVASVVASFLITGLACFDLHDARTIALTQDMWQWFAAGDLQVSMSLLFDHLSSFMLLFITFIGSLIHIYSVGYMKGDRGYARFMAYLNLFMFSMIMLVLGNNLIVSFLGWEGVGLCSYLLIGFWHKDHENNDAARKAFITNRVGDLGFLIGVFLLFYAMSLDTGSASLDYLSINHWAEGLLHGVGNGGSDQILALISAACFFIFWACTAKSAQIPLLTWLPDAMAGPTPVSALIHAATMVTAGIFMVCRLGDVFLLAPAVMSMITVVGILTALYAAIAELFQWDIKKVLAYSTVSQLGFMFMAVGVGAFDVALFHVLTHAFFKATLFLGAGSIIHALHHEQDMRKMGDLRKALPKTYSAMFFAWFAISGFPLFAGFMSKDLILERLAFFGGGSFFWYALAIFAALLTAFYMTRLFVLTFYSNDRVDPELRKDLHEVPMVMWMPVSILGLGCLFSGLLWCDAVLIWFIEIMPLGDSKLTDFHNMRLLPEYLALALP
ncbi:MAG: NADH-quinone oxidoreductase subunit L, partial [Planctomycetes bacterium]|nr:NADH-quinone oxidoreductase subunit L [Planctomycetota bacterium]